MHVPTPNDLVSWLVTFLSRYSILIGLGLAAAVIISKLKR